MFLSIHSRFPGNELENRSIFAEDMKTRILALAAILLVMTGCHRRVGPTPLDPETEATYRSVNMFAMNTMRQYYLWVSEISDKLSAWKSDEEPIAKVKEIRYKSPDGSDIDRWTQVTDDYNSFFESVNGTGLTYGFDYSFYRLDAGSNRLSMVVLYTNPEGPAEDAGLKRGDVIIAVNGEALTMSNYEAIYKEINSSDSFRFTTIDGMTSELKARRMVQKQVLLSKTFDCTPGLTGYIHYLSFTAESCDELIKAMHSFKEEGIRQLIIDLRYNTGGLAKAEEVFISMLAPQACVEAGDIFETSVFNDDLTELWGNDPVRFATNFNFTTGGQEYAFDTSDANPGLDKIYFIVTGSTASASEALITELLPYTDVELIGEDTYGKYCSGIVMNATDWYDDVKDQLKDQEYKEGRKYSENWGIYCMLSRFADKNGDTPCMPAGFTVDKPCTASDNPVDGHQLGDPSETMLALALERAGYKGTTKAASETAPTGPAALFKGPSRPSRPGEHIMLREAPALTRTH